MNGFVFYEGPSMLDGQPVVGIAVGLHTKRNGANKKTGAMVQTYILRSDVSPTEASKTGQDESICGDCVHRKADQGTCYVRVENGPLIVWKAYKAEKYPRLTLREGRELLDGRIVRLGAYGDPAAIPFAVWENLLDCAADWTGYTHQWNAPHFAPFKRFVMASCDTQAEYDRARKDGWRAFYVVPKGVASVPGAFLCPASDEAGKKLNCIDCTACNGTGGKAKASVFIPVHGVAYKQKRFETLITIGAR